MLNKENFGSQGEFFFLFKNRTLKNRKNKKHLLVKLPASFDLPPIFFGIS